MSRTGFIYKCYCEEDEKAIYIGKCLATLNNKISNRKSKFNKWLNDGSTIKFKKLFPSMKKYGFENFKFEIIEDEIKEEELRTKEGEYIRQYDAVKNGLNYHNEYGNNEELRRQVENQRSHNYYNEHKDEISENEKEKRKEIFICKHCNAKLGGKKSLVRHLQDNCRGHVLNEEKRQERKDMFNENRRIKRLKRTKEEKEKERKKRKKQYTDRSEDEIKELADKRSIKKACPHCGKTMTNLSRHLLNKVCLKKIN